MSQATDIIEFIRDNGSITMAQAYAIGCGRLASRIYDLRAAGINIEREMVSVVKANGQKTRVARYTILGGVPECFKA